MTVFLSASTVDYYKVDKEDIVVADTPETAPPALPPTAQTLPSQPLDVVFIERRGKLEVIRIASFLLLQITICSLYLILIHCSIVLPLPA